MTGTACFVRRRVDLRIPMAFKYIASLFREHGSILTAGSILRLWRESRHQRRYGGSDPGRATSITLAYPPFARLRVRLAHDDLVTVDEIFRDQVYSAALTALGDVRTIIDLGSNIGLACRYFAARCPGVKILGLEPSPANFSLLEDNVRELVRTGDCKVLLGAFWPNEDTPLRLGASDPTSSAGQFVVPARGASTGDTIRGMTMATILRESGFEQVDLLKVDIEGAEAELFKGQLDWLQRVHAIAIEFHADSRRASGFDAVMREHGFRIGVEGSHTVVAVRV